MKKLIHRLDYYYVEDYDIVVFYLGKKLFLTIGRSKFEEYEKKYRLKFNS